jgi:hypothetical protein
LMISVSSSLNVAKRDSGYVTKTVEMALERRLADRLLRIWAK